MHRRGWTVGLYAVLGLMAVATVVAVAVLYPWGGPPEGTDLGTPPEQEQATGRITAVTEQAVQDDFLLPGAVSLAVEVELDDGRTLTIDTVDETGVFDVGRRVVVAQVAAAGSPEVWGIVDFPRGQPLVLLTLVFVLAVIALGRWQGVRALAGLLLSAGLIVGFFIPALLDGTSPTVLALVTATAVMLVTLPLSHGMSPPVAAAAVGTILALAATVGLALLAVELTSLTGLASEDVQLVRFSVGHPVDLRGLLLAGMIIGTLGVLDDVTVSQSSTVSALRRADPSMPARRAFAEALAVGRDHIAATVNTLFLAYAGAALPLLILFSLGGGSVPDTLTSELVAQEIVRTLVGSIGLIVAVPITTAFAALALDGRGAAAHAGHVHEPAEAEVPPPSTPASASPPATTPGPEPEPARHPAQEPGPAPEPDPDPEASLRRLFRLNDEAGD